MNKKQRLRKLWLRAATLYAILSCTIYVGLVIFETARFSKTTFSTNKSVNAFNEVLERFGTAPVEQSNLRSSAAARSESILNLSILDRLGAVIVGSYKSTLVTALGIGLVCTIVVWFLFRQQRRLEEVLTDGLHDLRTPLTSILGYLEILHDRGEQLNLAQAKNFLAIAHASALQMSDACQLLLNTASTTAPRLEFNPSQLLITDLLSDQVAKFMPEASRRSINLQANAQIGQSSFFGDMRLLERMMSNLIENALHHTPPGGHIIVAATEEPQMLVLSVQDTGSGIHLGFFRRTIAKLSGIATQRSGSSGLGLDIVRKIVSLHKGKLTITALRPYGTIVRAALPRLLM